MAKRSNNRKKKQRDFAMTAFRVVQEATSEGVPEPDEEQQPALEADKNPDKNPHAVALGRLGGKKGGRARADKLTPEQRREIARKAAAARWRL